MDEDSQDDSSSAGTLEGSPNIDGTQQNANAYQQPMAYAPVKSQVPKVFGVFMMIYGVIVGLFAIIGIFGTGSVINDYEQAGINIS